MALLPKIKLKTLVSFPSNVYGGTGIDVVKGNGNFTIDLDYSEFAFSGTAPAGSAMLVWDSTTNTYVLAPPASGGGGSSVPSDALPLADGTASAGAAVAYSRGDHVHPAAAIAAMAAFTFKGNNTGSAAAPTDVNIGTLTTKASPGGGDFLLVSDQAASGAWKKVAISTMPGSSGGISDAPNDGQLYGRQSLGWVVASGSTSPSNALPLADGAANAGTSALYSRGDHVHPSTVTPAALTRVSDANITLTLGGAPATALLQAASITAGWAGTLSAARGGFGADVSAQSGIPTFTSGVPAFASVGSTVNSTAVRYDAAQSLTSTQQAQARTNTGTPAENVVINGDFRVNQGVYVSAAALAAGAYGHDQWKAGASGGDYSFTQLKSSTQITIASGKSLIQPIEDVNIVGGSYVLTWTGTAQARAGVNTLTPSGSYAASPLLISGQTAGTAMSIEFNNGTLGTVKLEPGSLATPFVMKPLDQELATCKRYYQKFTNPPGTGIGNGSSTIFYWSFTFLPMRAAPSASITANIVFSNGTTVVTGTAVASSSCTTDTWFVSLTASTTVPAGLYSISDGGGLAVANARL